MRYLILILSAVFLGTVSEAAQLESGPGTRTHLGVSIYQDFAVLSEKRSLTLPRGEIEIEITGIPTSVVPRSISVSSDSSSGFVPAQQNYRYDLLNRQSLLERFVGRKIKYSRTILEADKFESFLREGILLSVNPEIVQFGDVIEVEPLGTISLPYIPDDLKTEPTLVVKGENGRTRNQALELRYQALSINWETDYSLVVGSQSSLTGWVTVANHTGMDLEVDELRLVAGEVNKVSDAPVPGARVAFSMASEESGLVQRELGDYHAYDFSGAVSLPRNEVTQLRLLTVDGLKTEKRYRLISQIARYQVGSVESSSPSIVVGFRNDRQVDQPLPAGLLRVFGDIDGREVFLGEARIPHTPLGKSVEAEIGKSFDIRSERTQTGFRKLGERSVEISYRVILTNARNEDVTVQVDEVLNGDWQVREASLGGEKVDATTYRTFVRVPAGEESGFEYTLEQRW